MKILLLTFPKLVATRIALGSEMWYNEISTEMSSLYFGLSVFCLFEARVPEFDTLPLPPTAVHSPLNIASNFGVLALNYQNTASSKYNDDISLLI